MKTKSNYREYKNNNVRFHCKFSYPSDRKGKEEPCRALVSPVVEATGELMTKRQLGIRDSDHPVNHVLYGKTPQDIYVNKLPDAANELLMKIPGELLPSEVKVVKSTEDLAEIAKDVMEYLFDAHSDEWCASTRKEYSGQYILMTKYLEGVFPEQLTQEMYEEIINNICSDAASKVKSEIESGDRVTISSATQKKCNLFYLLIVYLKNILDYKIDAEPVRTDSRATNIELLHEYVDDVRIYDKETQKSFILEENKQYITAQLLLAVAADTGLRHNEVPALYWGSLHCIMGECGDMYYLEVTGQIKGTKNKRVNYGKTDAAYRQVALSQKLGRILMNERNRLSHIDREVNKYLMIAQEQDGKLVDDENVLALHSGIMGQIFEQFVKRHRTIEKQIPERVYQFDKDAQDVKLKKSLVFHSLRRNSCTQMHCNGSYDNFDLYRQMGHDATQISPIQFTRRCGKTQDELYNMCIRKEMMPGAYHICRGFSFNADKNGKTNLPMCRVYLKIPPNTRVEIVLADTEPNNQVSVKAKNLKIDKTQVLKRACAPQPNLSADGKTLQILNKSWPFKDMNRLLKDNVTAKETNTGIVFNLNEAI